MPKVIWLTRPTNHSGYLNILYLTPDGEVGSESPYTDLMSGHYIMGGPALIEEYDDLTDAGKTLIGFLDKGFRFYPPSSEEKIRRQVEEKRQEIKPDLHWTTDLFPIAAFSKALSSYESLMLLVDGKEPDTPVVFVDLDERDGLNALARDLARIYYALPRAERERLGLKQDWHIPST